MEGRRRIKCLRGECSLTYMAQNQVMFTQKHIQMWEEHISIVQRAFEITRQTEQKRARAPSNEKASRYLLGHAKDPKTNNAPIGAAVHAFPSKPSGFKTCATKTVLP
jgi:hypothetical protein